MEKKLVITAFVDDRFLGEVIKELKNIITDDRDISVFMDPKFRRSALPSNLGALRGATTETIHTKLIHLGLATDLAKEFNAYLKSGGAIVTVECYEENIDEVIDLLRNEGAINIEVVS